MSFNIIAQILCIGTVSFDIPALVAGLLDRHEIPFPFRQLLPITEFFEILELGIVLFFFDIVPMGLHGTAADI